MRRKAFIIYLEGNEAEEKNNFPSKSLYLDLVNNKLGKLISM